MVMTAGPITESTQALAAATQGAEPFPPPAPLGGASDDSGATREEPVAAPAHDADLVKRLESAESKLSDYERRMADYTRQEQERTTTVQQQQWAAQQEAYNREAQQYQATIQGLLPSLAEGEQRLLTDMARYAPLGRYVSSQEFANTLATWQQQFTEHDLAAHAQALADELLGPQTTLAVAKEFRQQLAQYKDKTLMADAARVLSSGRRLDNRRARAESGVERVEGGTRAPADVSDRTALTELVNAGRATPEQERRLWRMLHPQG